MGNTVRRQSDGEYRRQIVEQLDSASRQYIATRRSAQLPHNTGPKRGTRKRRDTANRLANARRRFWAAWFELPECRQGQRGQGWRKWLKIIEDEQQVVVTMELTVLWPEEVEDGG